tara:strand:+ start:29 stop:856 length:828 start_codon:yes stop_codon:yes gene_type:complete
MIDASPETLRAAASFQLGPQAFITLLDNDLLSGQIVTLDLSALGGGPPATTHEADGANPDDWAVGATLAASATNLAAVINTEMAGLAAPGTAVADGETVIITADAADWGGAATVASDAAAGFLLNDVWGSQLEAFHQFWDSEFNSGANVAMGGADYLHLYLEFAIGNASAVTQVQLRLKYGMGEAAYSHGKMYDEVGLVLGVVAGGVQPVDLPIVEYQFTVAAPGFPDPRRYYHKRLTIPVNDPLVKVLITTDNVPDADDTLEVLYARALRESGV